MTVILHGVPGSSYVQSVRLALAEKGAVHELRPVDFAVMKQPPYLADMHPFGRIPVLEHDGFKVYETQAILRYVDEAFPGPGLQPADARRRVRMNQAIAVMENYAPGVLQGGGGINFYRTFAPKIGVAVDEAAVARAVPKARACLGALEDLLEGPFFGGEVVNLADVMAAPVLYVLETTGEGRGLLAERPRLSAWLSAVTARWAGLDILAAP